MLKDEDFKLEKKDVLKAIEEKLSDDCKYYVHSGWDTIFIEVRRK